MTQGIVPYFPVGVLEQNLIKGGNPMGRPAHLPEFDNPPLNEVVLGVQFRTPPGYEQIRAGEVWSLYREKYPIVQEHVPLPPTFETFGPRSGPSEVSFNLVPSASHDRFWFITPDQTELLQFQNDRFLHNWRKIAGKESPYPRFEAMIKRFTEELTQLERYMASVGGEKLDVNQCEISYINHIPLNQPWGNSVSGWLNLFDFPEDPPELAMTFRRPIFEMDGTPTSRLICEVKTGTSKSLTPLLVLTLMVRGAPGESNIKAALKHLKRGRDLIVSTFAEITTERAHAFWRRTQ